MKRSPLRRQKAIKRRSKKTAAKYAGPDGRRALVERLLRERPHCESCPRIVAAYAGRPLIEARTARPTGERLCVWPRAVSAHAAHVCGGRSVDVHEPLPRSAGGDILDEENTITTCRAGHEWIGNHPREAMALGLLHSRHGPARTAALASEADFTAG